MQAAETWICAGCKKPYYMDWAPKKCDKCQNIRFVKAGAEKVEQLDQAPKKWVDYQSGMRCIRETKKSLDEVLSAHERKHGLPDKDTLAQMCKEAGSLKVGAIKGRGESRPKGIYFNIQVYTRAGGKGKVLVDKAVTEKSSSAVCYENEILPKEIDKSGSLLVHQSVAPCELCQNGYRNWAVATMSTIVVAYDLAYDGLPQNSLLIFSPAGQCFLL